MNGLLRLGFALTEGATLLRQRRAARRLFRRTAWLVVAASFAAAAVTCGLLGLWLSIAPLLGAVAATLVVALILLLLSGGAFALSRRELRDRAPTASGELVPAILVGELAGILAANKGVPLLAAALAGASRSLRRSSPDPRRLSSFRGCLLVLRGNRV